MNTAIKTLHTLSLLPFNTLISHCGEATSNSYANLGVATENCTTAWGFYNVKSAFKLARNVLFKYEPAENREEDEDCFSELTIDDNKNIYRNFTLQFNGSGRFFSDSPTAAINLTCFIAAFRFHLSLVDMMSDQVVFGEALESTWRVGLGMDRLLAFKVLLTKIFGLNHEVSMANFTNMCRAAFAGLYKTDRLSARFVQSLGDRYFELYERCHSERQDLNEMLQRLLPGCGYRIVGEMGGCLRDEEVSVDVNEMDYRVRDAKIRCRAWTKMVYGVVFPGVEAAVNGSERRVVEELVKVLAVLLSVDVEEVGVGGEARRSAMDGLKAAVENLVE